jgi:hypothetical protein
MEYRGHAAAVNPAEWCVCARAMVGWALTVAVDVHFPEAAGSNLFHIEV